MCNNPFICHISAFPRRVGRILLISDLSPLITSLEPMSCDLPAVDCTKQGDLTQQTTLELIGLGGV